MIFRVGRNKEKYGKDFLNGKVLIIELIFFFNFNYFVEVILRKF